jgi:hypothetical protein
MKKSKLPLFLFGLLSVLLVFGLLMIGCPNAVVDDGGNKPKEIKITTQPVSKTYLYSTPDEDIAPLTVTASIAGATFQWFSNSVNNRWTGEIIEGATGPSYTPPKEFGTIYYYVEAAYEDLPKDTSLVASVTFSDFLITIEPVGREYFVGDDLLELAVYTSNPNITGYAFTYQWYRNTTNSTADGTLIEGATESSYTPDVTAVGNYYFWVVITGKGSAADARESVVTSIPALIKIQGMSITKNPASSSYLVGQAIAPLTVAVSVTTNVTYQWYSNTIFSNEGGTAIPGATGNSYRPTVSAAGEHHFYVVVTQSTDVVTSTPATIRILTVKDDAPTQFTIGSTRLNYVRGVGGTGSFMFRTGGNADASPDADVKYVDQLFGELGCNILRIMVQDDYLNYIQNTVQSRNQDIFFHNARDNFFPVIKRANELGGYVFANPWTAPVTMKTRTENGQDSTDNPAGGWLRQNSGNYVDYADHLRGFMKWLNDNDAPIFCLGILNEPDYGMNAAYEGMGMSGTTSRDWFRTVGHFTTQSVSNRNGASVTGSIFATDIIPGYGGGGPTHHVLTMSGDTMGNVIVYMNPQIQADSEAVWSTSTGSGNRIEVIGRHYYADASRYTQLVGSLPNPTANPPVTGAWFDRPQLRNYKGPYEEESLAQSPQMYAPGSTPGLVKREVWQTEHDFNYHSNSTQAPASNVQNYWNSAFAALQDVDWCLRVVGESVFCWWYSSSYSGLVTSYQMAPPVPPRTVTPRGRAFAHYARYVNETWLLDIERTRGDINFNATNAQGTTNTTFNAGSTVPKISAFEDVNGKFISLVMYAPPHSTAAANGGSIPSAFGSGGTVGSDDPTKGSTQVGRIEIVLPEGFEASSATAIRSYGNAMATGEEWDDVPVGSPRYWIDEPAFLGVNEDGCSTIEVNLKGGNVISVMVRGEWTATASAGRHFEERVRPYTVY